MRRFKRTSLIWLGMAAALILALGGCLTTAADITPPPDEPRSTLAAPSPTSDTAQPTDQPVDDPVSPTEGEEGVVTVEILDRSGESLLGEGLEISLEGYDQFELVYQEALPIPPGGQVSFREVPFQANRVFFASVPYGGAIYRSEIVQVDQETTALDLQVEIFETTMDRSGLVIDRLHVLIEFPQPDLMQVVEIFILSNLGPATIVAESPDQPSVEFSLPEGAGSLQFEDGSLGQRFILTGSGFGDTVSIPPGAGVYQVVVSFTLPYPRNRLDFEQRMDYPLNAAAVILPAGGVSLKGDALEDLGVQSLPGEEVQVYSAAGISRDAELSFRITGKMGGQAGLGSSFSPNQVIPYAAGIAGIAGGLLLTVGVWLYLRGRRNDSKAGTETGAGAPRAEILDSILALEDLYQNGEISQESFEGKRSQLKEQLRKALEDEVK